MTFITPIEQSEQTKQDDVQGYALPILVCAAAGAGIGALIGIGFGDAIAEPINWQGMAQQLGGKR